MYDARAWDNPTAAVKDMKAHGVRTLYLETANYHNPAGSATMFRPADAGRLIEAAHAQGIKVVAWYLPGFSDPTKDWKRTKAALDFRSAGGQKFDSFTLDIEASIVKNVDTRNARLHTLSDRIRAYVGRRLPAGGVHPVAGGHGEERHLLAGVPLQDARRHLRRVRAHGLLHLSR